MTFIVFSTLGMGSERPEPAVSGGFAQPTRGYAGAESLTGLFSAALVSGGMLGGWNAVFLTEY
ncbi:MAG: hypothetical protein IH849_01485 [Acidobacteria bacterium]|nr:hypothetical protein [Acidobacteriota bacterium]